MRFGAVAIADAVGAVLVHTTRALDRVLKKGRVLSADDVAALAASGLHEILCARLEPDELAEDEAAMKLASALTSDTLRVEDTRTGRANLYARVDGLIAIDRAAIDAINSVDEAVTVATIAADTPVRAGDIVATVKIIPFAVPAAAIAAAVARVVSGRTLALAPWRPRRAGLILTRFSGTHETILDRSGAAQRERLIRCGGELVCEVRVAHDEASVAAAITQLAGAGLDPILALGASAIIDRRDVIPAAIERAGGTIVRFGMPVDPGNLILIGRLGTATVIGVPGCARSTKRSGFDWVLERVCAGVPIASSEIAGLGVGGLLDDVAARGAPRGVPAQRPRARVIAAVVLAAGRASRMGSNKLLAELDGIPIVRHAVLAALGSAARPVIVITGNEPAGIRAALAGLDVTFAHNAAYADGMAGSLRVGLAAAGDADAALICLGDMPRVQSHHFDTVIAAATDDATIVVPSFARKRGNPVLWPRRYFGEMSALTGDVGARALIERHADHVHFVPIDDPAILVDIDTPAALAEVRNTRES